MISNLFLINVYLISNWFLTNVNQKQQKSTELIWLVQIDVLTRIRQIVTLNGNILKILNIHESKCCKPYKTLIFTRFIYLEKRAANPLEMLATPLEIAGPHPIDHNVIEFWIMPISEHSVGVNDRNRSIADLVSNR